MRQFVWMTRQRMEEHFESIQFGGSFFPLTHPFIMRKLFVFVKGHSNGFTSSNFWKSDGRLDFVIPIIINQVIIKYLNKPSTSMRKLVWMTRQRMGKHFESVQFGGSFFPLTHPIIMKKLRVWEGFPQWVRFLEVLLVIQDYWTSIGWFVSPRSFLNLYWPSLN